MDLVCMGGLHMVPWFLTAGADCCDGGCFGYEEVCLGYYQDFKLLLWFYFHYCYKELHKNDVLISIDMHQM